MIKPAETQILQHPEEGSTIADTIQPNGGYNLLYDPYDIHQKALVVGRVVGQLVDQNDRYDRIDTIEDEMFQGIAHIRLADMQTDTLADLDRAADAIPYEGIGRDLVRLNRQREWLTARLVDLSQREENSAAAINRVLQQIDDVLGFRDEMAELLAKQLRDDCNWRYEVERNDIEPALQRATKDHATVTALYGALAAPWPVQRIRYPEKPPIIPINVITRPMTQKERKPAIGDRTINFAVSESVSTWSHPVDESIRSPLWKSQPHIGPEDITDAEECDPCDEWFERVAMIGPEQAEREYDSQLDPWFHKVNGTQPPIPDKPATVPTKLTPTVRPRTVKSADDYIAEFVDCLQQVEAGELPKESIKQLENAPTQHQRIAAFLISRAGEVLSAYDIGKFLFEKDGIFDSRAISRVRTLMGPKSQGLNVVAAMRAQDHGLQYGSRQVDHGGTPTTARIYRALPLRLTVLPETTDPAITWEPFKPN